MIDWPHRAKMAEEFRAGELSQRRRRQFQATPITGAMVGQYRVNEKIGAGGVERRIWLKAPDEATPARLLCQDAEWRARFRQKTPRMLE